MRQPMIAGNWKMHMTNTEATVFVEQLKTLVADVTCEVVVCPPFTTISTVADLTEDTKFRVGAQNVFHEESGAYTGEVSPSMLTDLGVSYVIVGHSERRSIFKEADRCVNKRVRIVLQHGMSPILCVGESLNQRESGETVAFIHSQLEMGLLGVPAEEMTEVVIAYEPIWAIGTGRTATAEQAGEVCQSIREKIATMYTPEIAEQVRILYGGSVKPDNAKDILAQSHVDGALVGGASLEAEAFTGIIKAC